MKEDKDKNLPQSPPKEEAGESQREIPGSMETSAEPDSEEVSEAGEEPSQPQAEEVSTHEDEANSDEKTNTTEELPKKEPPVSEEVEQKTDVDEPDSKVDTTSLVEATAVQDDEKEASDDGEKSVSSVAPSDGEPSPEAPAEKVDVPKSAEKEEEAPEDDADSDEHEEVNTEQQLLDDLDLEGATKVELLEALKKFNSVENMRILDKALREIKPHYEKHYEKEREDALHAFTEAGNDSGDFDFKGDDTDAHFFSTYELLRGKKQKYFSELEKSKDANLTRKLEILEQLRELVDGEESTTSINALKALQNEWKAVGHVPGSQVKSLWANYNALMDRFYDNRSIYFELKELDRKKNLEAKMELCERAEALVQMENLKEAIFQLNELHEEYKHIGPVPKDDQEPLWQRFKSASDEIYAKRKEFVDELKKDLGENAEKKQALGDRAAEFLTFNSDRITEWNKKTKELLALQKEWDKIGGLPRDRARQINKHFWSSFKQFFNNKSAFFKTLEGQREENLAKKQELLKQAEEIKESEEWDKTANALKDLQSQWREIGPVPDKYRNDVYKKFKAACDRFFERKRSKSSGQNKEFDDNLKKKEQICKTLSAFLNADTIELEEVYDLLDQYAAIGFVPRNAIKKIHQRYDEVTTKLVELEDLSEEQRSELKIQVQVSKLKNSPHSDQKIHRKEGAIRRKISSLESDIDLWKTNIGFFAESKTADKLKDDFNEKIDSATKEIEELKKQLTALHQV